MVLDPAGLIAAPPPSGPVDSMAPSIGSRADPVPRKLEMDSSRSDSKDAPTTPNFEPCTGIAKGHVRDEVINHYSSIAYGVRQRPSLMLTRGIEHFPSLDACFAPAQVLSLNTMRMRQKTQSYDEGRIAPLVSPSSGSDLAGHRRMRYFTPACELRHNPTHVLETKACLAVPSAVICNMFRIKDLEFDGIAFRHACSYGIHRAFS